MRKFLSIFLTFLLLTTTVLITKAEEPEPTEASIAVYAQTSGGSGIQGLNISLTGTGYNQAKNTDVQGKAVFTVTETGTYTAKINLSEGSSYELVSGESSEKSVTLDTLEDDSIYFGVKAKTQEQEQEQEEEQEQTTAKVHASFYKSGSTSTKLDGLSSEQLKSLNNLTFHIPDIAKIVYNETIDLSSEDAINRLEKLDQYLFLEQVGEAAIASDLMPELDKSATITFYGLNIASISDDYRPVIVYDDQEASESQVKDVTLVGRDTITFEVQGFSVYAYRPTLAFEQEEYDTDTKEFTLQGKVDDLDSEISVYLNNDRLDEKIDIDEDGNFEIPLTLEEKENVVQVMATGISEQTYSETVTINYTQGTEAKSSSNLTLYVGIFLILAAAGAGGGYYYYKRKKRLKTGGLGDDKKGNQPKYDAKLLTAEERKMFGSSEKK